MVYKYNFNNDYGKFFSPSSVMQSAQYIFKDINVFGKYYNQLSFIHELIFSNEFVKIKYYNVLGKNYRSSSLILSIHNVNPINEAGKFFKPSTVISLLLLISKYYNVAGKFFKPLFVIFLLPLIFKYYNVSGKFFKPSSVI